MTPNINSNLLPNHGRTTINMIDIKDEWVDRKTIIKVEIEKTKETKEDENKKGTNIVLLKPLPLLYQSFHICKMFINDGMGEGIWNIFKGCNAISEDSCHDLIGSWP